MDDDALKDAFLETGMSKPEAAAYLGVTRQCLHNWLSGRWNSPDLMKKAVLAKLKRKKKTVK